MIRPLTFLSLVAAAGAGLHLYSVKHEVSQLERTLRETLRQTDTARERTAVLRAEWAMLNEPERLRAAASKVLPLEVMQTTQFVRLGDMERRLPTAVAFAGAPSLFGPRPGERAVASADPVQSSAAVTALASVVPGNAAAAAASVAVAQGQNVTPELAALPLPPEAPPAMPPAPLRPVPIAMAAAERAPAPERTVPERMAPERVAPPHRPQMASVRVPEPRAAEPAARTADAARLARPRPVERTAEQPRLAEREMDRGINLSAPPQAPAFLRTALHTRPSAAPPAPRAPEAPAAGLGSMLGGASRPSLAPPVPVASANAGTLR